MFFVSQAKKTPLHLAAQTGQIEVCSTLLKMKADANAKDAVRVYDTDTTVVSFSL